MTKLAIHFGLPTALALAACSGETTEVEQPVVTDADDTGVDPIDTDQEAAPATGGAATVAPGTEGDVGEVGPSDVPRNQADALNVTEMNAATADNAM
jgi:hypothetical protein